MPWTNPQFALVCSLIVCLLSLPAVDSANVAPSWQGSALTMSIAPAAQRIEPAHAFAVQVMVDGAANLGAFEFDLTYNPAVVTVTGVELGPFLGSTGRSAQSLGPEIDQAGGTVSFGAFSFGDSPGPEGGGSLATVTLVAAGPGRSALQLHNVSVTDTEANLQAVSVQEGTVNVTEPAATSAPTMTASPTSSPMATATRTAASMATFTPTGTATATATSQAAATPTVSARATETPSMTVTAGVTPAPSETPSLGLTETPTPVTAGTATGVPAVTGPSSTPTQAAPAPVTSTRLPTPTHLTPGTPSLVPQPLATVPATGVVVERPLTAILSPSPVTVASPVAALSDPLCWLPVGGAALILLGRLWHFLRYRYRE